MKEVEGIKGKMTANPVYNGNCGMRWERKAVRCTGAPQDKINY